MSLECECAHGSLITLAVGCAAPLLVPQKLQSIAKESAEERKRLEQQYKDKLLAVERRVRELREKEEEHRRNNKHLVGWGWEDWVANRLAVLAAEAHMYWLPRTTCALQLAVCRIAGPHMVDNIHGTQACAIATRGLILHQHNSHHSGCAFTSCHASSTDRTAVAPDAAAAGGVGVPAAAA